MGNAVHKILEEDQTLRFYRDPQTNEFLLAGTGQQHIEVIVSRLKKRYNVDVALHAPKIPYRETIRGQGRSPGPAQEADRRSRSVRRLLDPDGAARTRGWSSSSPMKCSAARFRRNYIPAIEKGMIEAAANGYLAGYPVVDFKVRFTTARITTWTRRKWRSSWLRGRRSRLPWPAASRRCWSRS